MQISNSHSQKNRQRTSSETSFNSEKSKNFRATSFNLPPNHPNSVQTSRRKFKPTEEDSLDYDSDATSSSVSTLTFELSHTYILPEPFLVFCPFGCETQTPFVSIHPLLDHLQCHHGIKVADVGAVAGVVTAYLDEWARRVREDKSLEALVSNSGAACDPPAEIITEPLSRRKAALTLGGEPSDQFDRSLRLRLTKAKLEEMLKIQEKERNSEAHLPRKCLFCKTIAEDRASLFRHMFSTHSFNIGLPDNLVYVSHFLDLLSEKLANLKCLYCERTFKSSPVLRKHMRKKRHFRISPRNHQYDRFYIINYLEPGKDWETLTNADKYFESDEEVQSRKSVYSNALTGTSLPQSVYSHGTFLTSLMEDDVDAGWSDWDECDVTENVATSQDSCPCLFCDCVAVCAQECVTHMAEDHFFDLPKIQKERSLSLYQTLILINFLRKAALTPCCSNPACGKRFSDLAELSEHVKSSNCLKTLPFPHGTQVISIERDSKAGISRAFGDETTLHSIAKELIINVDESKLPEKLAKVGDTIVSLIDGSRPDNIPQINSNESFWNDPQYLFPSLEGDPLLSYGIEIDEDEDWDAFPVVL
jgi:hypothetical protein